MKPPYHLGELVVTSPAEMRAALDAITLPASVRQAARWRPDSDKLADPVQAACMALRSIARRIASLSKEITALGAQLGHIHPTG